MKIKYTLEKFNYETCVALGYFDGIHIGHQAVISKSVKISQKFNLVPTVFTFLESPKFIANKISVKRIISQEDKEHLLAKMGIKLLYSINLEDIINFSPRDFVKKILVNILNAKYIVCGFNYHFGREAIADTQELIELCKLYDIKVKTIVPKYINNFIVSSSKIRNLLLNGNINLANKLLGRNFHYNFSINKEIHIFTNIHIIKQIIPSNFILIKSGIYKSYIKSNNKLYNSMTYINNSLSYTLIYNKENKFTLDKNISVYFR